MKEVLKERAKSLASQIDSAATEETVSLIEITLGQQKYGVELIYAKEAHRCIKLTTLPNSPSFIFGVTNLRQRIVSILNLKNILSISKENEERKDFKVLVVEKDEREFGLLADEIIGEKTITKSSILPIPSTFTGMQKELLKGVTSEKLIILNVETLFQKKEFVVNEEIKGKMV